MPRPLFLYLLVAALFVSICATAAQRDLFVGDETKYGQVIREMRQTGRLLVPQLGGEPYSHKPPIHFWIIYGLTIAFGTYSIWPFVLQSIIGFLVMLWLVARFGRALFGEERAPWAVLFFSTFLLAWMSAETARMDMTFIALLTAGALFLQRFLDRGTSRDLLLAGTFGGLAVLVKGPMAPIVLIVLLLLEWWRRGRLPRGPYLAAFGLVLFFPLLWLVPAALTEGQAYIEELLVKQSVRRAVDSWVHKQPVWFYVTGSPALFFPWFFSLVPAIVNAYRDRTDSAARDRRLFCVNAIWAVLISFSALSGKLPIYMLPATPFAAMLLADFVSSRGVATKPRSWALRLNLIPTAVILLGAVAGFFAADRLSPAERQFATSPSARGFLIVAAVAGFASLVYQLVRFSRRDLRQSSFAVALALAVPLIYFGFFLPPLASELGSTRPLIRALAAQNVPGAEIALYQCPFLWSEQMPAQLRDVRYIGARGLIEAGEKLPKVVATRTNKAAALGPPLSRYRKVDSFRLIGKDFDVYRLE